MREGSSLFSLDMLPAHALVWERMRYYLQNKTVPQALLFTGQPYNHITSFVQRLMACVLCEGVSKPCGQCRACSRLLEDVHPDCLWIRPEKPGSLIKIEQIRELQWGVYQTPQCGTQRFVMIDEAQQLNLASANALLKILEEPPSHTVFILIATNASALPATVLSRCQHFAFEMQEPMNTQDYFMQVSHYPIDSPRGIILSDREAMTSAFNDFLDGRQSCCQLASAWSKHALDDVLWFLYLLTSTYLIASLKSMHRLSPVLLLKQIDVIARLTKKRTANLSFNETLALESILLGYLE